MAKKVTLCIGGASYAEPFSALTGGIKNVRFTNFMENIDKVDIDDVNLAIFTGGEDVGPKWYGHMQHMNTYTSPVRDEFEVTLYHRLRERNIPMIGICRGAQFLCVMAGGKLVQDITNHGQNHKLRYIYNGKAYTSEERVCSTHHQQQYPFTIPQNEYKILAYTPEPMSAHYVFGKDVQTYMQNAAGPELTMEPDIVMYERINALGIQYHPEMMGSDTWGFKFAGTLAQTYIKPRMAF